jgi:hypothetical protein
MKHDKSHILYILHNLFLLHGYSKDTRRKRHGGVQTS